jgi:hypothetical protein
LVKAGAFVTASLPHRVVTVVVRPDKRSSKRFLRKAPILFVGKSKDHFDLQEQPFDTWR